MVRNKKAQSAVEYLMTYGWAILIIIVVGAALWKLGIFDTSKWAGAPKLVIPGFSVADSKLTGTELTFVAGTTLGKTVTFNSFNATFAFTTPETIQCTSGGVNIAGTSWSSGAQKTVICDPAGTPSGSIAVTVAYDYTDPDSALTHSDSVTSTLNVE